MRQLIVMIIVIGVCVIPARTEVLPGGMQVPSPVYSKVRDWLNHHPNQIARILECISDHDDGNTNSDQTKILKTVKNCEEDKLK